jgi:hypothetical protein
MSFDPISNQTSRTPSGPNTQTLDKGDANPTKSRSDDIKSQISVQASSLLQQIIMGAVCALLASALGAGMAIVTMVFLLEIPIVLWIVVTVALGSAGLAAGGIILRNIYSDKGDGKDPDPSPTTPEENRDKGNEENLNEIPNDQTLNQDPPGIEPLSKNQPESTTKPENKDSFLPENQEEQCSMGMLLGNKWIQSLNASENFQKRFNGDKSPIKVNILTALIGRNLTGFPPSMTANFRSNIAASGRKLAGIFDLGKKILNSILFQVEGFAGVQQLLANQFNAHMNALSERKSTLNSELIDFSDGNGISAFIIQFNTLCIDMYCLIKMFIKISNLIKNSDKSIDEDALLSKVNNELESYAPAKVILRNSNYFLLSRLIRASKQSFTEVGSTMKSPRDALEYRGIKNAFMQSRQ